jgi:hypothetical protein
MSALTFSAALPSYAYSWYSGASVGSDGTVYGWGVTDATPPPGMYHTAYVYTTLTSPNGRVANYGQVSAPSTVREDVSLPFDPTDLGTYVVASLSSGFCHTCVCWWFQNCPSGAQVLSYSPIQHNYPNNPLPQACWISSFFDAVRNGTVHQAEDVIYTNTQGGGTTPPYGTAVYAAEAGEVTVAVGTNGPASQGYPACIGMGSPGNYVKITAVASGQCPGSSGDSYSTIYFHVKPVVSQGQCVSAGHQISTLDNSGCQSGAHVHVARKNPSGVPVNFTLPCTNPVPTSNYFDGLVNDSVPGSL